MEEQHPDMFKIKQLKDTIDKLRKQVVDQDSTIKTLTSLLSARNQYFSSLQNDGNEAENNHNAGYCRGGGYRWDDVEDNILPEPIHQEDIP